MRPSPPSTRRDRLLTDPLHSSTFARLRDRHRRITERRELTTKGLAARCATCGTVWPCEVGQALAIIDLVLIWP